jgi:hypothetical protein
VLTGQPVPTHGTVIESGLASAAISPGPRPRPGPGAPLTYLAPCRCARALRAPSATARPPGRRGRPGARAPGHPGSSAAPRRQHRRRPLRRQPWLIQSRDEGHWCAPWRTGETFAVPGLDSTGQSPGPGGGPGLCAGRGPQPGKRRPFRICYRPVGKQEPRLIAGAQASCLLAGSFAAGRLCLFPSLTPARLRRAPVHLSRRPAAHPSSLIK